MEFYFESALHRCRDMSTEIFKRFKMVFLLMVLCQFFINASNASLLESSQQFLRKTRQNEVCTLDAAVDDGYGICQNWSQCKSAQTAFYSDNIAPIYCQYDSLDPIVCCPLTADPDVVVTTISTQQEVENQNKFNQIHEQQRKSERECEEKYFSHSISKRSSSDSSELDNTTTSTEIVHYDIVGGRKTAPREFTHMAELGWKNKINGNYDFLCGGTLISPEFVLTAAHCTSVMGAEPEIVRIGGEKLEDEIFNINKTIDRIYIHPEYRRKQFYNDIALLKLSTRSYQKPACLWQTSEINDIEATAIGYGHTMYAGTGSSSLMQVVLDIYPNQECSRYYKPTYKLENGIIDSQMCAGDPYRARDTCQGDSGGPLMMKITKNYKVIPYILGVTSFGQGCAGGPPSIYIRISSYLDWIESIVWP